MMDGVEKIAVLGLGLMGGSLCLGLKKNKFQGEIHVYARRRETLELALSTGMADTACTEIGPAVKDADVVVVCVPVQRIPDLVQSAVPFFKENAVVTDVGSTKEWLHEQIDPILADTSASFVGSHPVAGSEKTGAENAIDSLYEHAVCVVTSTCENTVGLQRVEALWRSVGSSVIAMSPPEHDAVLARTSHLPHLVSSALAHVVARTATVAVNERFCGSGYRDMTRLAEGSPAMWHDITATNRDAIVEELTAMKNELETIVDIIKADTGEALETYLEQGRVRRFKSQ